MTIGAIIMILKSYSRVFFGENCCVLSLVISDLRCRLVGAQ